MADCSLPRRLPTLASAIAVSLCALALPGAGAAQTFQERVQACGNCHGEDGNSRTQKTPSLAGQPALFLTNQLILMRDKVRSSEAMAPFVKGLKDADIIELAEHYAKLPARPSDEPVDPALAARGEPLAQRLHCGVCHTPDFAGGEQIPRLTRQRIDYTIDTLIAYRDGKRYGIDNSMNAAMYGLKDDDIRALAHFLASRG
jgi:cytochrome c553